MHFLSSGVGSPLLPSPAAASMAAAASLAAARLPFQPPGAPGGPTGPAQQLPPTSTGNNNNNGYPGPYEGPPRHPFLPAGLGAALGAYHNPSFQTLLAGLSAQRQKLGSEAPPTPPDFQALLGQFPGQQPQGAGPKGGPGSTPSTSPTPEDTDQKPEIKNEEDTKEEPQSPAQE